MKSQIEIEAEQLEKLFEKYFHGVKIKKHVQKDCARMVLEGNKNGLFSWAHIRITYFKTSCINYLGYETWDVGGINAYLHVLPYIDRAFDDIHKIFSRKTIDLWCRSSCSDYPSSYPRHRRAKRT